MEKKRYVVNCEICDTRKVREESLAVFDEIVINTSLLLVDGHSKEILNRLPTMVCNEEYTLEAEGDTPLVILNDDLRITGDTYFEDNTIVCVNGDLSIEDGAGEALKKVLKFYVNGDLKYSQSVASGLDMGRLLVNGDIRCMPRDCLELSPVFSIDKYFPLRARRNGRYYVKQEVRLTDEEVDIRALLAKDLHFETASFLVREEFLEDALGMFGLRAELEVIPAGFAYVEGDVSLERELPEKYGNRLYINGNLLLTDGGEEHLSRLEKLYVRGDVRLLRRQREAFEKVDAVYGKLVFVKGKYVANKVSVTIDQSLLDALPDGLEIGNCVNLKLEKDVEPQSLIQRLAVKNCVHAFCSPEQRSALELVCANVTKIHDREGGEDDEIKDGQEKKYENAKVVNTELHVL